MKKLLTVAVIMAMLLGASVAQACQTSATPPANTVVTTSEPFTRLHNSLLTESPAAWWQANKDKVITSFYNANGEIVRPEVTHIPAAALQDIGIKVDEFEFTDAGQFQEYLEFLTKAVDILRSNNKVASASGSSYSSTELGLLARIERNVKQFTSKHDNTKAVADSQKALEEALSYGVRDNEADSYRTLSGDLKALALGHLAAERQLMNAIYEKYPEKALVDALFIVTYLNEKTVKALPAFNFEFFYADFDRANLPKAVKEAEQILLDAGVAALPYIERAWTELNGCVYVPAKQRKIVRRPGESIYSILEINDKQERIKDQRCPGGALCSDETDAQGNLQQDTSLDIPVSSQLLPVFLDFLTVFNQRYNTPFHVSEGAQDHLKLIYNKILKANEEK